MCIFETIKSEKIKIITKETYIMTIGIDELGDLVKRSDQIISHIKSIVHQPDGSKHYAKSFKMGDAAKLIGRHPATIREAEKQGVITSVRPESSSTRGFSISEKIGRAHV